MVRSSNYDRVSPIKNPPASFLNTQSSILCHPTSIFLVSSSIPTYSFIIFGQTCSNFDSKCLWKSRILKYKLYFFECEAANVHESVLPVYTWCEDKGSAVTWQTLHSILSIAIHFLNNICPCITVHNNIFMAYFDISIDILITIFLSSGREEDCDEDVLDCDVWQKRER